MANFLAVNLRPHLLPAVLVRDESNSQLGRSSGRHVTPFVRSSSVLLAAVHSTVKSVAFLPAARKAPETLYSPQTAFTVYPQDGTLRKP